MSRVDDEITDAFIADVEATVEAPTLAETLERLAAISPDVRVAGRTLAGRFKHLAGCTCTSINDVIYLDADCPVHGRERQPENWEDQ